MNKRNNNKITKQQQRKNTGRDVEIKISDIPPSTITLPTAFTVVDLSQVAQGTGYNNRVGLSIYLRRLHINAIFKAGGAGFGSNIAAIRMLIVQDKQQIDSTSISGSDVLSSSIPVTDYNWFNKARFKIWHDELLTINQYSPIKSRTFQISLAYTQKYSSGAGSAINKNGLYLLLVSDNSVNPPTLDLWSRLTYTDA